MDAQPHKWEQQQGTKYANYIRTTEIIPVNPQWCHSSLWCLQKCVRSCRAALMFSFHTDSINSDDEVFDSERQLHYIGLHTHMNFVTSHSGCGPVGFISWWPPALPDSSIVSKPTDTEDNNNIIIDIFRYFPLLATLMLPKMDGNALKFVIFISFSDTNVFTNSVSHQFSVN